VARGWRRLNNEELHILYASPDIIRVMKSRKIRWTGHGIGEKCIQYFGCKIEREELTEDLGRIGR
jgi:hypothetical protein